MHDKRHYPHRSFTGKLSPFGGCLNCSETMSRMFATYFYSAESPMVDATHAPDSRCHVFFHLAVGEHLALCLCLNTAMTGTDLRYSKYRCLEFHLLNTVPSGSIS